MNDDCKGCFGSGRFGTCGSSEDGTAISRLCFRCHGSGKEPIDELLFVAMVNRRVAALSVDA